MKKPDSKDTSVSVEQGSTKRERKFLSKGDRKRERLILCTLLGVSLVTAVAYLFTLAWTRHFAGDDVICVLFWAIVILFILDRLFFTRLVRKLAHRVPEADSDQLGGNLKAAVKAQTPRT
jgi:hypothetical protein